MAEKLKDVADDLSSLNNNKDVSADITKIVRKSTIRSMASTLIPVPGVDIGANIYNLAKTYKEINDKLGIDSNDLSSSKVLEATVKGIGVKELAKTAAKLTIASSLKTIPLVGSLAGTVLEYSLFTASKWKIIFPKYDINIIAAAQIVICLIHIKPNP